MEGRWNVGEVCMKPVPQPILHGSAHSRRMQLLLPPKVHCSMTLETSRANFVVCVGNVPRRELRSFSIPQEPHVLRYGSYNGLEGPAIHLLQGLWKLRKVEFVLVVGFR